MKVAVTGAAGLLGRYVVKRLLARGDNVLAIDSLSRYQMMGVATPQEWPAELKHERCLRVLDRFDSSDVFAMIREEAPQAIVHAAAQTSHPRSIETPAEDFEVNAAGTMRLLEFLRQWTADDRPPRLVFVSSAKVYGENVCRNSRDRGDNRLCPSDDTWSEEGLDGHWRDSDGLTEACPVGDQTMLTPFGISKAAADMYVQVYSKLYGIEACCLRPGCFTGRGSLATEAQNFLPPLVRAMVRGETYTIYGHGGRQVRDVLHADDLARAVLDCIDAPRAWRGEVMNVCGGEKRSLSILEAADMIERLTGKRGTLKPGPMREGDWPYFVGSSRRIKSLVGWAPKIDLEEIVRELCEEADAS